jgi:hypothetical protein
LSDPTLRRDTDVDLPGLVGARWWQSSVVDPIGRRKTLLTLLAVGGGVLVTGLIVDACSPNKNGRKATLALQREYGWSFGAASESVVFNGQSTEPFNPERLAQMVQELAPRASRHRPFYVQTLFESPTALPKTVAQEDPSPIVPLKSVLHPILTDTMRNAYRRAQLCVESLASAPGTALVVDLDGQDSVAFAAGACALFDPIFLFDNWPHPRGVVPAHVTLAAAAYYQPLFAKVAETSTGSAAPAMFVLDDQRLAPYSDSAEKFDNRWVARLPSAQALRSLGVGRICYVAPTWRVPLELDDLNDDLVADHASGISILGLDVRSVDSAFPNPPPSGGAPASVSPATPLLRAYDPVPRRTPFSSGSVGGTRPSPSDFGTVPVILSVLSGALLGVAWSRSGSWNRSSSWGGGGG